MSTGIYIVLIAAVVAALILFVPQTGINRFLEEHKWLIPFIVLTIGVVTYVEVKAYSVRLHDDQIAACERRNPEVVSEVVNLENDRSALRHDRDLVRGAEVTTEAGRQYIDRVTVSIEKKSEAIGEKVSARAQYSEHPGGPPARAVIIDCSSAYPG